MSDQQNLNVSSTTRRAFTLVELLVAIFVFSLLMTGVVYLYQYLMFSYRATTWKQERLRESGEFWNHLRRHLEEAANIHIDGGGGVGLITALRPVHLRSVPVVPTNGTTDGDVLCWVRARMNPSNLTSSEYEIACRMWLTGRTVSLSTKALSGIIPPGEAVPGREFLHDVSGLVIQATGVRWDQSTGEYLGSVGPGSSIGTQLEISIIFEPSKDIGNSSLRITQNHKFKVNVDFVVESASTFAY